MPSDEELMKRYCDGDALAFDRLYARYRGPLYRYIRRQCSDCPEAEELYQDVWLRLVRSHRQWDGVRPFRPWIYRIARNRVIDHWRNHQAGVTTMVDELIDESLQEPVQSPHDNSVGEAFGPLLGKDSIERLFGIRT